MRKTWLALWRSLVPETLQARVFDPTVDDLDARRLMRLQDRSSALVRLSVNFAWATAVLIASLQCRLLRRRAAVSVVDASQPRGSWVAAAARDFRLTLRRMRREPAFATFAVATLAFGIGANVAVFSLVNAYLVAPLPLPDADRLVRVCGQSQTSAPCDIVSYPNYIDLRDAAPEVDLAAHIMTVVAVGPESASDSRQVELVTGNYFRVLQLTPLLGRLLAVQDDETEMAHPVVVLSEAFWRGHDGARPDIVGTTVLLNNAPYEVVGVAPAAFHGTQGVSVADMWAPVMMQKQLRPRSQSALTRGWGWLRLIGRLAPNTSLARAQAGLDRVSADLNRRFPSKGDATRYVAAPATSLEEGDRAALLPYASLTLALTGLLLVVTCANLAGLMQARAIGRRRELAIRQSLGAGRGRLLVEWLTECVTIAALGGGAGLLLARALTVGIDRAAPAALVGELSTLPPIDWRVATFAFAISLVAALLVGLPTARGATSIGVADVLKDEATSTSGGRRGLRLRRLTVLVQVATAAVLLVGSGLLVTSLRNLRTFDPGFRADHLAGLSIDLKRRHINGPAAAEFTQAMLTRVRSLPGIVGADVVSNVPLTNNRDSLGFRVPGYTAPDGTTTISIDVNVVGRSYFSTMGLDFVQGRSWAAGERAVVINQAMAKRFWPSGNPVAQSIELVGQGALAIAGVVRDSAYYEVGEVSRPFVYLPAEVATPGQYTVMARTSVPAEQMLTGIVDAVRATDARVQPTEIGTFESWREAQLYPQRLLAWATVAFGAIALGLSAVGLFGVVSTSVAMRTREIGIRMALGARPDGVLASVLRESAALVLVGAACGLVIAYGTSGLLRQWLFGVSRFDLTVYALVIAVLTVMTLLAAGVPARRAAQVDPVQALKN
jgi:predicted permease